MYNLKKKMMLKRIFTITVIVFSMLFVQGCNNDDVSNTARVQLKLIDLPGDYLEVNVNIVDVQYNNSEEGWRSFERFKGEQLVDLTELIGGVNLVLSDEIIPAGTLKQIRLVLGDGNTVKIEGEIEEEGETFPLETPSAQQSGLKLNLNTVLEGGFSYTFVLDWDVQKSIVKAGNSGIYNLKPVIRVVAEVNSGTIKGRVADIDETKDGTDPMPIEGATLNVYDKDDTSIGTTETNVDGLYMFQGLPAGDYKLKVEKGDYNTLTTDPILVEVGVETTKDIHLTKSTGNISGRIADSSETDVVKIPLGNAKVDVYAKDDTNFDTIIATETTSNEDDATKGNFTIMDFYHDSRYLNFQSLHCRKLEGIIIASQCSNLIN